MEEVTFKRFEDIVCGNAHKTTMTNQFWSEDGVDEWLVNSGLLPKTGTYADVGCANPWRFSQTAFLRERGWSGIAIDGNPDYAPEWEGIKNATFVQAVLSDKPWVNFLTEPTNSLVSRIHELGTGVPAFKLRQVLETYRFPKIDFLAIDIESSEREVLHDFMIGRGIEGVPEIIVAEYNSCHKGRDVALLNMMAKTIYEMVHMTDSNAMLAAILAAHNAPLELAEVEPCELRAGQVLVRVLVSGICGKQIGEIRGDYDENAPIPRLLGHEGCGIVESVGPGVSKVKTGDKVVLHWRKGSGMDSEFPRYTCKGQEITSGRITTFSEMSIISENRLTKVPHETPNELCALLGCALSTALAVMENDAKLKMGESVLIVGCGGVGLNLIRVAKMRGASRVVGRDKDNPQFAAARSCGVDEVECAHGTMCSEGFDVIVDTTGIAEAISDNIPRLKSGGRFIMVGQPKLEASIVMHAARHMFDGEGKTIKASQGGGFQPDTDISRYVNMWRSGFLKIDGIVTDRFTLSRINDALDLVRSGSAGRVILEMV